MVLVGLSVAARTSKTRKPTDVLDALMSWRQESRNDHGALRKHQDSVRPALSSRVLPEPPCLRSLFYRICKT